MPQASRAISCDANAMGVVQFLRLDSRIKKARPRWPGSRYSEARPYLAMRSFDRLLPMVVKTVPSCEDEVTVKNFPVSVAQSLNTVEVGSPSVFTWMV